MGPKNSSNGSSHPRLLFREQRSTSGERAHPTGARLCRSKPLIDRRGVRALIEKSEEAFRTQWKMERVRIGGSGKEVSAFLVLAGFDACAGLPPQLSKLTRLHRAHSRSYFIDVLRNYRSGRQAVARLFSAWFNSVRTCSRGTPGNHFRKSSTLASSSRFSKSAFTGTRVPLNTHAPLTRSGFRSTAVQLDQSSIPQ